MSRKILIVLIVLAIILAMGVGVWYITNRRQQLISSKPLTQEYKTYVSKYGFSVSYPASWKLEEDDYSLARGIEHGKVPVWINDEEGDSFSIEYITNNNYYREIKDFIRSKERAENRVSNLVKEVEIYEEIGRKVNKTDMISIAGNDFYLFSGTSIRDKEEIYIAIFYLPQTETIASIKYFPSKTHNKEGVYNILRRISIFK